MYYNTKHEMCLWSVFKTHTNNNNNNNNLYCNGDTYHNSNLNIKITLNACFKIKQCFDEAHILGYVYMRQL